MKVLNNSTEQERNKIKLYGSRRIYKNIKEGYLVSSVWTIVTLNQSARKGLYSSQDTIVKLPENMDAIGDLWFTHSASTALNDHQTITLLQQLNLILLTWTIWRAPTNASKWRMGFNPYPANVDNMASSYQC